MLVVRSGLYRSKRVLSTALVENVVETTRRDPSSSVVTADPNSNGPSLRLPHCRGYHHTLACNSNHGRRFRCPKTSNRIERECAASFSTMLETDKMVDEPDDSENNKEALLSEAYGASGDLENTKNCYSKFAKVYHDMHLSTWKGPTALANAAAKVAGDQVKNATVLDFGAGTGLAAMAMKSKGFTTIDAMDVSKEMLVEAQRESNGNLYRNLHIGLLSNDFIIEPCTYDMIIGCGVIGTHVYAEEVSRLLPLIKPGGTFIYTIRTETDDDEFSSFYESLGEESKSDIGIWSKISSEEVGPLNIEVTSVNHRIVVLKREK